LSNRCRWGVQLQHIILSHSINNIGLCCSSFAKLEQAKELAKKEATAVSRSRRQTQIIRLNSSQGDETEKLLKGVAEKFFVQLSPPKIFSSKQVSCPLSISLISSRRSDSYEVFLFLFAPGHML